MIKSFIKFLKGKNKRLEKKLVNTEEYWEGAIEELNSQYKKIDDRYHEAKGIYGAKKDELKNMERNIKEMKITLEECKERYIETKSEEDKRDAERAFNELNELESKEIILQEEIQKLEETYIYIKNLRDNAQQQIAERKSNAAQNKSKVQISETIEDLTKGLDNFNLKEEKGTFEVNSQYYKNKSKLEEMSLSTPKKSTKKFEDFLKS
ncbi:MAG: hypothetical protein ACRC4T_15670 [Cetobacterium sp.]